MTIYYIEYRVGYCEKKLASDADALRYFNSNLNVLCIYRENETDSGLPFVIIGERE